MIFGKLIENVLTTNNFGKFENLVHILGISKVFVKILEIEPSFDFMLTVSSSCFYPWVMTCDYPVITQLDAVVFVTLVSWHPVFMA